MSGHECEAPVEVGEYPVEMRERVAKALERVKEKNTAHVKSLGLSTGTPEYMEEEEMSDPFYLVDMQEICSLYKEWHETLPGVEPCYAVKCNPNEVLLRLFIRLGTGFDCASSDEIDRVMKYGASPEHIVFANPCKMLSQIQHAHKRGVKRMTFDNVDELIKVAREYPDAEMILRIVTDDSHSLCRFSSKFGAQMRTVPSILAEGKKLGVKIVGVSFHVGSGCSDAEAHAEAARNALKVFEMGKEYGYNMNILDIGGGFQGGVEVKPTLKEVADKLLPVLAKFPEGTRFIAEPGRFFVAKSHTLVANIHSRRVIYDENDKPTQALYYINDGVYHSYNCIFFDHQHPVPRSMVVPGSADAEHRPVLSSTVLGPTCDALDCVIKNLPMPLMEVGEWVFTTDMGAYTNAALTHFNGFNGATTLIYMWGDDFIDDLIESGKGVEDYPPAAKYLEAIAKKV